MQGEGLPQTPIEGDRTDLQIDATPLKVRRGIEVALVTIFIANSVNSAGRRAGTGVTLSTSDAKSIWNALE